jgi:hypothetical protein
MQQFNMSTFVPESPKTNIHHSKTGNATAAVARRFGLTFATMRWKVMSSSSILSFPFPNFLSAHAHRTEHLTQEFDAKIRRDKNRGGVTQEAVGAKGGAHLWGR